MGKKNSGVKFITRLVILLAVLLGVLYQGYRLIDRQQYVSNHNIISEYINTELDYNIIKQAELDNMYVEEKYRKLGIGKLLFIHFKEECKKKSITEIKVTASFKNRNAIEFYIKNGFEESELTLKQKI